MRGKKIIVSLFVGLLATQASANEGEARTVFTTAITTAFNFKSYQIADEISLSFPHFTKNGRASLISLLDSSGIVKEAVNKNGSLQTTIKNGTLHVEIAKINNNDIYIVTTNALFQWQRCIQRTCVPVGNEKPNLIKAEIISVMENNRPAMKVNHISFN